MTHVLVDGLCFSQGDEAAGEAVAAALPRLAAEGWRLTLLDRGGATPSAGLERLTFPAWTGAASAYGALLLQRVCDQLGADAFLASGAATPTRTPAALVDSGAPPRHLPAGPARRWATEAALARRYAREIVGLGADACEAARLARPGLRQPMLAPTAGEAAEAIAAALARTAAASALRPYRDFARRWAALRAMQVAVDGEVYADA